MLSSVVVVVVVVVVIILTEGPNMSNATYNSRELNIRECKYKSTCAGCEGTWGTEGVVTFLRNLSSRWRVISFTLRPLYPRGGIHREPTFVEAEWSHIRS